MRLEKHSHQNHNMGMASTQSTLNPIDSDQQTRIYQIYYREEQKAFLETNLSTYFNGKPQYPEACESGVFAEQRNIFVSNNTTLEYQGFVSWKFPQKTQVSVSEFKNFIEINPGYDVYFINPFPHLEGFASGWEVGDFFHSDFLQISRTFIAEHMGLKTLYEQPIKRQHFAFCNYWVGNKKFWEAYVSLLEKAISAYYALPKSDPLRMKLDQAINPVSQTNYLPYILERLFSCYVAAHPEIRALKYDYSLWRLVKRYDLVTALFIRFAQSPFTIKLFRIWVKGLLNLKLNLKMGFARLRWAK